MTDDGAADLAWREAGGEAFQSAPSLVDGAGRVELRLPVGAVDVMVWVPAYGYAPRAVSGLHVTANADPATIPVDLIRGATVELLFANDSPPPDLADGRLLFFVNDREAAMLRGPFAEQGGESHHRINGVNMWLGEPGLMHRLVSFDGSRTITLRGLTPGPHRLRSFPDDLVFDPAEFDVTPTSGKFVVRWRRR